MSSKVMKVLAILIWVLGIPASVALGYHYEGVITGATGGRNAGFQFSWTQTAGFAVLFFTLGILAWCLGKIIANQKKLGSNQKAILNGQKELAELIKKSNNSN